MDLTDLTDQQHWELYLRWLDSDNAANRVTGVLCQIRQANFLLAHLVTAQEQQFIREGGDSDPPIIRGLTVYC
jgi:four helix bundle suffix protein